MPRPFSHRRRVMGYPVLRSHSQRDILPEPDRDQRTVAVHDDNFHVQAPRSNALTDEEFWVGHYGSTSFVKYPLDNDHFNLLFAFAERARIRTAMEVGSFPGPFLAALGECGIELEWDRPSPA